ncbi:MAG: hypothetical protein OEU76_04660 [Cyclobacteriaceae bacterium]|nr:hypothetical protein [Cyclobacteriaceae bacterium]
MKRFSIASFIMFVLIGCDSGTQHIEVFSYSFDLSTTDEGWSGDFSDYPEGDSVLFELEYEYTLLPENISKTRNGIKVAGNNLNEDLFMFIKRKITGLQPNTTYSVLFNIRFASDAPTGDFGIEGAPGESVVVKVGATEIEPKKVLTTGNYLMNIDKGNQQQGGQDVVLIGNVGVTPTTTQFTEVYRNNNSLNSFIVTADAEGELWIIIGTDSDYEGATTLYYTSVDILFNQVN